jgi:hypothetical protein
MNENEQKQQQELRRLVADNKKVTNDPCFMSTQEDLDDLMESLESRDDISANGPLPEGELPYYKKPAFNNSECFVIGELKFKKHLDPVNDCW